METQALIVCVVCIIDLEKATENLAKYNSAKYGSLHPLLPQKKRRISVAPKRFYQNIQSVGICNIESKLSDYKMLATHRIYITNRYYNIKQFCFFIAKKMQS